jgi:hypothetical protein
MKFYTPTGSYYEKSYDISIFLKFSGIEAYPYLILGLNMKTSEESEFQIQGTHSETLSRLHLCRPVILN